MKQRHDPQGSRAARLAFAVLALAMGTAWFHVPGVRAQSQDLVQLMLLEGDSLSVRFPTPLCGSTGLEAGMVIEAEAAQAKWISGLVAIEEGASVKAKVLEVEKNGRKGKPGRLKIAFESVTAADGAEIFLQGDAVEKQGSGKHLVKKILTLFLIKGGDACIRTDERFHPRFRSTSAIYVPHP